MLARPGRRRVCTYQYGVDFLFLAPLKVKLQLDDGLVGVEVVRLEVPAVKVLVEQQLLNFIEQLLLQYSLYECVQASRLLFTQGPEEAIKSILGDQIQTNMTNVPN